MWFSADGRVDGAVAQRDVLGQAGAQRGVLLHHPDPLWAHLPVAQLRVSGAFSHLTFGGSDTWS